MQAFDFEYKDLYTKVKVTCYDDGSVLFGYTWRDDEQLTISLSTKFINEFVEKYIEAKNANT